MYPTNTTVPKEERDHNVRIENLACCATDDKMRKVVLEFDKVIEEVGVAKMYP